MTLKTHSHLLLGHLFVAVSKRVHLNVASEALEYFESGLSKH